MGVRRGMRRGGGRRAGTWVGRGRPDEGKFNLCCRLSISVSSIRAGVIVRAHQHSDHSKRGQSQWLQ